GAVKPSHGFAVDGHDAGMQRIWRKLDRDLEDRDGAPNQQHDDHHGGDDHDLEGLSARFVDALDVLVPKVEDDHDGEGCGEMVFGKDEGMMRIAADVFDESGQVLSCGNCADGASQ